MLVTAESLLVSFAGTFDAAVVSGEDSLVLVDKLGGLQRLIDGLLAMAAKRVDDTYAYTSRGAKDAGQVIAAATGGTTAAAKTAIGVAKRLEGLPATNAAVRAGKLSSRATEMIVEAARRNPGRELELIATAAQGLTRLKDACVKARAEVENPQSRRFRQHKARYLRTWTDDDGMYRGSFALVPEVGGEVKAVLDERTRAVFRERRGGRDREELEAYGADALVELVLERDAPATASATANGGTASATASCATTSSATAIEVRRANNSSVPSRTARPANADSPDIAELSGASTNMNVQRGYRSADSPDTPEVSGALTNANEQVQPRGVERADLPSESIGTGLEPRPGPRRVLDREDKQRRRTKVNVHIVIDHAALVRGNVLSGERCEIPGVGPVAVEWVREVLGDAFVTAIIAKGKDITTVAHLSRYINAELKTALLVSGRECDIEGCVCRGYLEIDHSEIDFAKDGPTAFWNLGWLCSRHHAMKSSGWSLGARSGSTRKRCIIAPEHKQSAA